jgi:hypothetical protein
MSDAEAAAVTPAVAVEVKDGDQEIKIGSFTRTKKEYTAFLPGLFSISMIAMGATGECPAIPALPLFCILAGAFTVANAAVPFLFRIEKLKAEGREKEIPPWVNHLATFLGGFTLALAVWGAVLTFPNGAYFGGPADEAAALAKYGANATADQLDDYVRATRRPRSPPAAPAARPHRAARRRAGAGEPGRRPRRRAPRAAAAAAARSAARRSSSRASSRRSSRSRS